MGLVTFLVEDSTTPAPQAAFVTLTLLVSQTGATVSDQAIGTASLAVALLSANPLSATDPGGLTYFAVTEVDSGSVAVSSLLLYLCAPNPSDARSGLVSWWTGTAWQTVPSGLSSDPSSICRQLNITNNSTPSISQLNGAFFAVGVDHPGVDDDHRIATPVIQEVVS
jgi:hypothetical protein